MDRDLLAWGALVTWCGISLLWSPDPEYGIFKLRSLTLQGLLPGIAILLLARVRGTISTLTVQRIGLLLLAVILVFGEIERARLIIGDSGPIWIARGALLLVCVAIWSSQGTSSRIGVTVLGVSIALLTQSRGPVVAFVAANVLLIAAVGVKRAYSKNSGPTGEFAISKSSLTLFMVALAGIALWTTGLVSVYQADGSNGETVNRFSNLDDPAEFAQDGTVSLRIGWYSSALDVFLEQPIVGTGLGGYKSAAGDVPDYPHSLPLEIGSELGIVGLGFWLSALFLTARRAWRSSLLLTVMFAQALGYTLFSGNIGGNYLYVVIAFLIIGYLPCPRPELSKADFIRKT